ncbi:protein NLP8 isoform X1 [Brassica napus]|uniref:protein NLP8 isoform X1 n=1 Tax=Brassica napus TaxID=3708 RepID=UPI00207991E1|nr:protein NLP8 isoform X1 [Brassica napus]XP_022554877.2 protein NLP8 isoform X1 [Brassica napus]XP_048608623.1 protein NLP8 isoform X1 [Brassica napus]
MEHPFASRDKVFGYQDMSTEEMDGFSFGSGVRNLISDDMFNSSSNSELMNFDSFSTWCNSPSSATDILFAQYGLSTTSQPMPFGAITSSGLTRSFHDLESSYYGEERLSIQETSSQFHRSFDGDELTGKRRRVAIPNLMNCTIPRSLSHSLDEKMLKALSLFLESSGSGEGILAQVWTPIKIGDQHVLSTCDQAYLLDPRLSQYREVSRKFTFASEANQCSFPGLPGRVFISGVPEWTSNVVYYKTDEYLRMKHAIDNEVRGSIAIPILEASGTTCCAVMELVTSKEKPNFDTEMDSVCRALQAVNLRTSASPRPQFLSSNQRDALAEIQDVLLAVCHAHRLPLALAWIPCSYGKGGKNQSGESCVLCVEETACYVNDTEMEGFVHVCLEHCLRAKEGIVGKAFVSNQPFFASDVKAYDISEYPLVQHARKYGLNAAVAIKLRSTYTGEDDYILELFLPVSMKGSLEQQLLLDSLSGTMQRICRTLRTVSDVGETNKEVSKAKCSGNFRTMLSDSELNSTRNIFSDMSSDKDNSSAGSQGTYEQEMSKARTQEKKKSTTEKNVSLSVLQQHFSGSLKDAAKSLGGEISTVSLRMDAFLLPDKLFLTLEFVSNLAVCPTTLKRICRQHGIMRWPSRKINKVNRSLRKIQTVLDSVQGVEGGLKFDSATGEFVAVCPFIKELDTQKDPVRGQEDVAAQDTSFELLEAKSVDNEIKLEEDIITNGSFVEVNASGQQWAWMAEQSSFHCSEGIKNNGNLSSQAIRCSGSINEPNQSVSCSMSGSSNGSGAVMLRSSSTSMDDSNQVRTQKSNSSESGSTKLTVKATYREDTIRFKFVPSLGCSQLYKEVGKRFKLQEESFQLKYLDDEEEWVMLVTDSDLQECLEILYGMGKHTVKFLVRDLPAPIGSSAGSNCYLGTGL